MSDLEQIRDALESAKTFLGQEILWKESNYVRGHGEKKYSELCVALSIIDRMIETPAPQGWKLVPIEPTMEMIWSGIENTEEFVNGDPWYGSDPLSDGQAEQCYKAMLSAAPTPAPTEKVDLGALKREINSLNGRWCKDDGKTTTSDDLIDYLANTGRLLR